MSENQTPGLNAASLIVQRVLQLRKQRGPQPSLTPERQQSIQTQFPNKWFLPEQERPGLALGC